MKKFLIVILFLSVFPSFVAAQTTTCIDLKNNMLRGAKNANTNNEVTALQNFLKAKGFLYVTPNGSFGPATLAAVKKFQTSAGLGSVGTSGYGGVGPKSRAKIKEMTCGKVVSTIPNTTGISATTSATSIATTTTINGIPVSVAQTSITPLSGDILSVDIDGYAHGYSGYLAISKRINGLWEKVLTDLPSKGLYYLDDRFVGYGASDFLICSVLKKPYSVEIVAYKEVGEKAPPLDYKKYTSIKTLPVYQTASLSGEIKIDIRYFSDKNCQNIKTFSTTVIKK